MYDCCWALFVCLFFLHVCFCLFFSITPLLRPSWVCLGGGGGGGHLSPYPGGGGGGCCYTDKELIIAEHISVALVFLHASVCYDTAHTTPVSCEYILKRIKATKNQEAKYDSKPYFLPMKHCAGVNTRLSVSVL